VASGASYLKTIWWVLKAIREHIADRGFYPEIVFEMCATHEPQLALAHWESEAVQGKPGAYIADIGRLSRNRF
jgi:hypothetical protein